MAKDSTAANPGLLERLLGFIIRSCQAADLFRTQNAAIHLVGKSHVSDEILEIRKLSLIDLGEVRPRREHALACISRMIHIAAPKNPNLEIGVQQNQVGRDFQRQECRVILSVQIGTIVEVDVAGIGFRFDHNSAEVKTPLTHERVENVERLRTRQQQTLDQMMSEDRITQYLTEEKPLADFEAILVFLKTFAFIGQVSRRGEQPRKTVRRPRCQLLDPHRTRAVIGKFPIDLAGMIAEELPRRIRHQMHNRTAGPQFDFRAVGLQWKDSQQNPAQFAHALRRREVGFEADGIAVLQALNKGTNLLWRKSGHQQPRFALYRRNDLNHHVSLVNLVSAGSGLRKEASARARRRHLMMAEVPVLAPTAPRADISGLCRLRSSGKPQRSERSAGP